MQAAVVVILEEKEQGYMLLAGLWLELEKLNPSIKEARTGPAGDRFSQNSIERENSKLWITIYPYKLALICKIKRLDQISIFPKCGHDLRV